VKEYYKNAIISQMFGSSLAKCCQPALFCCMPGKGISLIFKEKLIFGRGCLRSILPPRGRN
jgi:hypothetical protein